MLKITTLQFLYKNQGLFDGFFSSVTNISSKEIQNNPIHQLII